MPDKDGCEIPIAARYRGPGPAKYMLPPTLGYDPHDARRWRAPAYSLAKRLGDNGPGICSPGPVHGIEHDMVRTGKVHNPTYVMGQRLDHGVMFRSPAPGTYSPEKYPVPHQRWAPCYSMAKRTQMRRKDVGPGPSAYTVPGMIGCSIPHTKANPCYTMRPQTYIGGFAVDYAKTPGPAKYDPADPGLVRNRGPQYTMRPLTRSDWEDRNKPGPGAYSPDVRSGAPQYSMGIKHSEFTAPLILDCDAM